jgi:hypothetical protein
MSLRHTVVTCVTSAALGVMALSVQAQTPSPPTSPAFERAYLGEMDAATRAEVEKRATGGNTVVGVTATILLNNYQSANPGKTPGALSVAAVDFVRGVVVIQTGTNQYDLVRFDPKTLSIRR